MRAAGLATLLIALPLLFSAGARAAEPQYVGAPKCRSCHKKETLGKQYQTWQAGPHRRAYATLANEQSLAIAAERGLEVPPQQADACLRCHVSAHGVSALRIAHALDLEDGVQCESCHGPGREYRKKKIMSDSQLAREKGLWDAGGDASICTSCHNEDSPTFDPTRYTLADGTTVGFDFEQAKARMPHEIPEETRGRYLEIEAELKAQGKKVP